MNIATSLSTSIDHQLHAYNPSRLRQFRMWSHVPLQTLYTSHSTRWIILYPYHLTFPSLIPNKLGLRFHHPKALLQTHHLSITLHVQHSPCISWEIHISCCRRFPHVTPPPSIFGSLFGVEYQSNNHTYIHKISQYKYVCTFGFDANMNMELSKPTNFSALQFGLPSCSSCWLISTIHEELDAICTANTNLPDSNQQHVAPAATTQTFLSSAIGSCMPDHEQWTKAYADDPCTAMLLRMVSNPSLIDDKSDMSIIHYVY